MARTRRSHPASSPVTPGIAPVALLGTPTAPTADAGDSTEQVATTAFVQGELVAKAPLASPTFTGDPKAPTASPGDNDTSIATTAFVTAALASKANLASPALTGNPTAPTASPGDNDTSIATTAFVAAAVAAVSSVWTTVFKSADQTRTSTTTLAADSELTIALAASTRYSIRARIFYTVGSATPDFQFDTNYSGTTSSAMYWRSRFAAGDSPGVVDSSNADATLIPTTQVLSGAAGVGFIEFDIVLLTGTAGTFSFRWAQDTSSATTVVVKAGSYLEYAIVS